MKVLEFEVPPDTEKIVLRFKNTSKKSHLGFSIYDSLKRFRGWVSVKEGKEKIVEISRKDTRYFKGMYVPFGTWKMEISTRDRTDDFDYELEIKFEKSERKWRWVMGELHTHTIVSDGKWTVEELAYNLGKLGVEFFFVTDHNAYGLERVRSFENVVAFPGMELTTPMGHFLLLNVRPGEVKLNAFSVDEMRRYIFGPAHPAFPNDDKCKDCALSCDIFKIEGDDCLSKTLKLLKPDFIEIWNSVFHGEDPSEHNMRMARIWLDLGGKIPVTAGGDVHGECFMKYWMPTWVYVPEVSHDAILNSISQGLTVVGNVKVEGSIVYFEEELDVQRISDGEKISLSRYDLNDGPFYAIRKGKISAASSSGFFPKFSQLHLEKRNQSDV